MQHFADFGYVRALNKDKRNLLDTMKGFGVDVTANRDSINSGLKQLDSSGISSLAKSNPDMLKRGRQSREQVVDPLDSWQRPYNNGLTARTKIAERKANPRKISMGGTTTRELDVNGFTDIRPNNDPAIDATHLGFRKDPFKGYGGMMEEPVDMITKLTDKKIMGRGINRFDMRGGVEP